MVFTPFEITSATVSGCDGFTDDKRLFTMKMCGMSKIH
ncbi:hypothetical protein YpsIP31758_2684 [Yersinia pseudotuberculosis IP 31758]|uniref:Uncharacterized protein n=2 Tax=Yersinia pseudotuberculosis complex TaxID=1649845 RepID=A0A0U1QZF1_YERP3|nr:hypothetical protein YpsIP31758_2684 [Yersinia pseudotuberculosis IP 31758]EIR06086.1 hypothetical protein YPPY05_1525 [Yersinia pestis PY-05]EIT34172.1 hypothetical protein YPPY98_1516 [Yersinia pestis PY-98]